MPTDSEKIDKILELQLKQNVDIALIKQAQEIHLSDYMQTKNSHFKLKDEFKSLSGRIMLISTVVIGGITAFFNYLWKSVFGN
jgi:hypothetical protein